VDTINKIPQYVMGVRLHTTHTDRLLTIRTIELIYFNQD
jgi:hypothetical protein